jgi:hypothetical protein
MVLVNSCTSDSQRRLPVRACNFIRDGREARAPVAPIFLVW